jgi:hypothetical protein
MPGLSSSGPPARDAAAGTGGDIMHPMFVKLFIETDPDDLLAEEDRRRRARPSRRARPAMAVRPAARDRQHRPRP